MQGLGSFPAACPVSGFLDIVVLASPVTKFVSAPFAALRQALFFGNVHQFAISVWNVCYNVTTYHHTRTHFNIFEAMGPLVCTCLPPFFKKFSALSCGFKQVQIPLLLKCWNHILSNDSAINSAFVPGEPRLMAFSLALPSNSPAHALQLRKENSQLCAARTQMVNIDIHLR